MEEEGEEEETDEGMGAQDSEEEEEENLDGIVAALLTGEQQEEDGVSWSEDVAPPALRRAKSFRTASQLGVIGGVCRRTPLIHDLADMVASYLVYWPRETLFVGSEDPKCPAHFSSPWGIDINQNDQVVVGDSEHKKVKVFDSSGAFVKEFGCGDGDYCGVACDPLHDRIFAAAYTNDFVDVWSADQPRPGRLTGLRSPLGIACSLDGRTAVALQHAHSVVILDSTFKRIGILPAHANTRSGLDYPRGVCFGPRGRLFVCDRGNNRIVAFDRDGFLLKTYPAEGATDVALTPRGELIFTNGLQQELVCLAESGKALGVYGGAKYGFSRPGGVTVSKRGEAIVFVDSDRGRLCYLPDCAFPRARRHSK